MFLGDFVCLKHFINRKMPIKSGIKKAVNSLNLAIYGLKERRNRDSNPRRYNPQQFSRLPQ